VDALVELPAPRWSWASTDGERPGGPTGADPTVDHRGPNARASVVVEARDEVAGGGDQRLGRRCRWEA
jgi:hypothetical protein